MYITLWLPDLSLLLNIWPSFPMRSMFQIPLHHLISSNNSIKDKAEYSSKIFRHTLLRQTMHEGTSLTLLLAPYFFIFTLVWGFPYSVVCVCYYLVLMINNPLGLAEVLNNFSKYIILKKFRHVFILLNIVNASKIFLASYIHK